MKTTKLDKKLWLNKKTVVHLDNEALSKAKGGITYPPACPTTIPSDCMFCSNGCLPTEIC